MFNINDDVYIVEFWEGFPSITKCSVVTTIDDEEESGVTIVYKHPSWTLETVYFRETIHPQDLRCFATLEEARECVSLNLKDIISDLERKLDKVSNLPDNGRSLIYYRPT